MILYLIDNNVNQAQYYVIAESMNEAEEKVKGHLKETYSSVIKITELKVLATSVNECIDKSFKYQYKLIL